MEPFKNLINHAAVKRIERAIVRSYPSFDGKRFLKGIDSSLHPLELKGRVIHISERLKDALPSDIPLSLSILTAAVRESDRGSIQTVNEQSEDDEIGLSGFLVWPLTRFVSSYGLGHFKESMSALHAMTQVFTAEFDIRPFLIHYETKTLKHMRRWTEDPNHHVRRLVSEGTRPLLPWGERLIRFVNDPTVTWDMLDALKHDPSPYVRKSVANHINDHSKNHGDWVIEQLSSWANPSRDAEIDWIIRHSTRTLVKRGHSGALRLHGVETGVVLVNSATVLSRKIALGDSLRVRVELNNPSNKSLVVIVDHELNLLKANGKHAPRVVKGKKLLLDAGARISVEMNIPVRPVTVRKYYSGVQFWSPIVNGLKHDSHAFKLTVG